MLLAIGEGLFFLPSSALTALTLSGVARADDGRKNTTYRVRLEPVRPIIFQTQLIH